jgi:Xaa-Pro aminopeptidase
MRLPILLLVLLLVLPGSVAAATPVDLGAGLAARRAELMRQIGPDGMLILLAPPSRNRNGDVDWPFRQDDNLLYLSALENAGTSLVLVPGEARHREIVFAADSDPARELWTGRIPDFKEVSGRSGVQEVVSNTQFRDFLRAAMEGQAWGTSPAYRSFATAGLPHWQQALRSGKAVVWMVLEQRGFGGATSPELALVDELRRSYPELQFRDAFPLLTAMRMVKSASEIATVQRAIDVTVEAQKAAMQRVKTATHEYQVQATIEFTFRNLGACCWGFPSIVASGRNATTLHYETNNDLISAGGLMLTDIGAEVEGYTADVTRTYPQRGRFSPEQRAIYEAVLRAQTVSMALMKPGARMSDVHEAAIRILGEDLLRLGLVSRNQRDQVRLYFPHGLGHQLGLRVHDVVDRDRPLAAGMIVTNEPGIYVRTADVHASPVYRALPANERAGIDAALARYADIGVRIEDDILITEGAPKNLSAAAPRTVQEIEDWMRADMR